MKYRIKEQYGYFIIEKNVEYITYEHNFLSRVLFDVFGINKGTEKTQDKWVQISDRYDPVAVFSHTPKKFKTIDEAYEYVNHLEPKYHPIPKEEAPTDSDVINAATKCIGETNFTMIRYKKESKL